MTIQSLETGSQNAYITDNHSSNESKGYSLSELEIYNLKIIFNQIKYILTRFSRNISYMEKISQGYKMFLLKIQIQKNLSI